MHDFLRILISLALASVCGAQQWELGAEAGLGLFRDLTVTARNASATTGFFQGPNFSALLGQDRWTHFGGEFRYTYGLDDIKIGSGAAQVRSNAQTHSLEYGIVVYPGSSRARVRPFLTAGVGGKLYRGTGPEVPFQPLTNLAVATHTKQFEPLVSFGGGIKFAMGRRGLFRIDARDGVTPFPDNVIAPVPPAAITQGWLHNFLLQAGVSATF